MISQSNNLGVPQVARSAQIVKGNTKANTLFCSYIFNTKHGLKPLDESCAYDPASLIDHDVEGTLEIRQFTMWINSMELEGQDQITDIFMEVQNGVLLCKVVDRIQPGCVDWAKVHDPPKNVYDQNGNNE